MMKNRKIWEVFLNVLVHRYFDSIRPVTIKTILVRLLHFLSGHLKFWFDKTQNDKTNVAQKFEIFA